MAIKEKSKRKISKIKNIKLKIDVKDKKFLKSLIGRGIWAIISFVLTFSGVANLSCPFGISAITVSGKRNLISSVVGAGLGYILFADSQNAIRYFSAVIITGLGTFAIQIFKADKNPRLSMVLSFLCVLATGFVMNVRSNAVVASYALTLGEAVLAMGGSFFFHKTVHSNTRRLKFKALPITDMTCVLISVSVVLSGLSFLEIYGVAPARIAAIFFILSAVRFGSQRWGLIISLCLGFAIGISRENSMFLLGAYAFSTLVSSLFASLSSLSVGVGFSLSMTFFAVAAGMGSFSVCCVIESVIASLVLVLLPEVLTDKITELWESGADIAPEGSLRQSLIVRLRFASSALAQVSENVRDVREKINSMGKCEPMESEIRMVAADQFFSISDMLEDLAFEFDEAESFDFKSAGKIRRLLGEYEIYPENISVIVDRYNRTRIEILAPSDAKGLNSPRLRYEISKICSKEFENGRLNNCNGSTMLSFVERANYALSVGFAQYCAEGQLCGDTVKTINDTKGHMILIISDGMGKGSRAALDGAMGAGLLSKLLSAGFGFDSSLKVVNSALLVKSSEESLATLDCARVDLFTGKCEFYKAGAPRSYILKNGKITKCELTSMPAGILRGIEFAKRTTMLNLGDEIILMSDGVTDVGEELLEGFLHFDESETPNDKAQAILNFAVKHTDDRHRDDMSVIVAKLIEK